MDLKSGLHVPQELLDQITEHIRHDTHTVLNLCLVSRNFCSSAQSVLYRKIRVVTSVTYRLSRRDDPGILDVAGCTRFLATIAALNRHLGTYVHEFHYTPENGSRPAKFWELMNRALYYMSNLRVFAFRNFVSPSKRCLFWGTRFQLEEFYWDDGYSIDVDGDLVWFLKTQPQLRVLAAPLGNADIRVPHFPKLQTFIGDGESMEHLVRNNSVEKFRWRASLSDDAIANRESMRMALSKLRVLSIGSSQTSSLMPTLALYLQSLEVLHVNYINALHVSDSPCLLLSMA
ncbi:hypothetical protein NP233_g164 [Leucocoprinus birnbaumii]|uniref:F-box domain-containing protein n=1 Tax=Leucocoprinus birnbaumii TaxID=56174 RepID=A0AAD5W2I6_9AGAR|nr:hypothetical protein NP233_g164 [Leucocoprinus birnbaumii]